MNDQLDLALAIPKGIVSRVHAHGLEISQHATAEELILVGNRLLNTRSILNFALGSLFDALVTKRAVENKHAGMSPEQRLDEAEHFVREFAAAHNLHPKDYREVIGVARFYRGVDLASLGGGLTFEHFREAMWGVALQTPGGGVDAALTMLRKAAGGAMNVSDFRRYIRGSTATSPKEGKQTELALYSAVFEFRRWARREKDHLDEYSPERARMVVADLGQETLIFLDALRQRAAQVARSS